MNQELLGHVLECFNLLIEGNPERVEYASAEITPFYEKPDSIPYLFEICKTNQNPRIRMLSSVGLFSALRKHIGVFDIAGKQNLFDTLLSLLSTEVEWTIRRSLLDDLGVLIEKSNIETNQRILEYIHQFASHEDDFHLQLSLLLALKYLPQNDEDMTFYAHLIERGYQSKNHYTLFCAAELLFFPKSRCFQNPIILSSIESIWAMSISLFDIAFSELSFLPIISRLFIFAINNINFISFDPLPLLSKLLSFFSLPNATSGTSMTVSNVIYTIVLNKTDIIIESGAFVDVIHLYATLGINLFNESPDDSYIISFAPAFLSDTFEILGKNPVTIPAFLETASEIASTPAGAFVSCVIFSSILGTRANEFTQMLDNMTPLIEESLASNSRLLCETASYTAFKIISIFSGESADQMMVSLLQACHSHPTTTLLEVLANAIAEYGKTDGFYDNALSIIAEIIGSPPLEGENGIQSLALSALAALTMNSSLAVFSHVNDISTIVTSLLGASEEMDYLKPHAISCMAQTLLKVGLDFPEILMQFAAQCVQNLTNDDINISLACFKALDNLMKIAATELMPLINEIIPFLLQKLSFNPGQKYLQSITYHLKLINSNDDLNSESIPSNPNLENIQVSESIQTLDNNQNPDINQNDSENAEILREIDTMRENSEEQFENFNSYEFILSEFEIVSISLKILSTVAKTEWKTLIPQFGIHLLKCAENQSRGITLIGKEAASFAVCELSKGFGLSRDRLEQAVPQLESIVHNLLPDDCNSELMVYAFNAAAKIVEWFDYNALQIDLKKFLDCVFYYLSNIIPSEHYSPLNRRITHSVLNFIDSIIVSADDISPEVTPHLTSNFMKLSLEFMASDSARVRSVAVRYFSYIIPTTSYILENELKEHILAFAMHCAVTNGDSASFMCLKAFGLKEKPLAMVHGNEIISILAEFIQKPIEIEESSLLKRDSAVSCLSTYIELMQESIDLNQLSDIVLSALPLVSDYNDIAYIMGSFFPWLLSKVSPEKHPEFLRVLIVQFGNSKTIMMHIDLSPMIEKLLISLLKEMLSKIQNPDEYCLKILNGNEFLLNCLHNAIAQFN